MDRLTTKNLDDILKVIQAANTHIEVNELQQNVLNVIHNIFHTSSCNFFLTGAKGEPTEPVSINIDQDFLRFYQAKYFGSDPFEYSNLRIRPKPVVTDEDLFPFSKFSQTKFFNDFLKPQQISRQMVIYLQSGQKVIGYLGLHRSKKCNRFNKRDLTIGENIAPHLVSALKKAQLFACQQEKGVFFRAICDNINAGIAIFNLELQPVLLNKSAVEFCSRIRGEDFTSDKEINERLPLPAEFYEDCLSLKCNLSNVSKKHSPPPKRRIIEIPHLGKYSIHTKILNKNLGKAQGPFLFVSIEDASGFRREVHERTLKGEYNLTKREIEIVDYVSKGFKNMEIAGLLYISEGTVKNHLKNIFTKMGVQNRTSLIHEALDF